jgi:hypothetical protein
MDGRPSRRAWRLVPGAARDKSITRLTSWLRSSNFRLSRNLLLHPEWQPKGRRKVQWLLRNIYRNTDKRGFSGTHANGGVVRAGWESRNRALCGMTAREEWEAGPSHAQPPSRAREAAQGKKAECGINSEQSDRRYILPCLLRTFLASFLLTRRRTSANPRT